MAKTVYDKEVVELSNGTEVTLAPLPIGRLRKFMKQWEKFQTDGEPLSNDDTFDIFVSVSGIGLYKHFEHDFENGVKADGELSDEYREFLEDTVDVETATRIIEVCGGISLSDPKLEEAVLAAQAAVGQN